MGFLDRFKKQSTELKDKAADIAAWEGDKIDAGIDKAADLANKATQGKFDDKIDGAADKAKDAAEALGLTAARLIEHGLIDKIVREPVGGAHRNPRAMAIRLKAVLLNQLAELEQMDTDSLLEQRYQRLRGYGSYVGG